MAAALTASLALAGSPTADGPDLVRVIVREVDAATTVVEDAVVALGGVVERQLPIIGGFAAEVPQTAVAQLAADDAVLAITPNAEVTLNQALTDSTTATTTTESGALLTTTGVTTDTSTTTTTVNAIATPVLQKGAAALGVDPALKGAPRNVAAAIGADQLHAKGITGKGVDVAVIDSGVVPVDGLAGKIATGIDLSFEAGLAPVANLDTFGHGSHMAGIIAGRASGATLAGTTDPDAFRGIAPGARIVSVKVASANGATDVSQVIAAIDWTVQNRNTDGRNIRVLNLSFGTDGAQSAAVDPLVYATEVAIRNGITVVVSAGNLGSTLGRLTNPAISPSVIAVGAVDTKGTVDRSDDTIPTWSQRGDGTRNPDVVAPGVSIVSVRNPGSYIDATFPTGLVGTKLFKGSGTSQAAAVVSGAAALLISENPSLEPHHVKGILTTTADPVPGAPAKAQGNGMIDLPDALSYNAWKRLKPSGFTPTGTGTLEASRGTMHVTLDTDGDGTVETTLSGETTFTGSTWSGSTWSGSTWSGSLWKGSTWSGSTWSGSTWSGSTWSGSTWSGSTWSGSTWSGSTWSGSTWSGSTWSGSTWSGSTWSGDVWSSAYWSGSTWE